jgi:hypothetical protein
VQVAIGAPKMSTPLTKEIIEDIIEPFMESVKKKLSKPTNSEEIYPLYLLMKRLNNQLSGSNVKRKKE